MRLLLLNPDFRSLNDYNLDKITSGASPPIGLLSIAAYMREKKYEVDFIDAQFYNDKQIEEEIKKRNFDVALITSSTPNYLHALRLARICKSLGKLVLVGGAHPTAVPHICAEEKDIDVVVYGEGELTLEELLPVLMRNGSLKKIKGIAYREKNKVMINPQRELIKDLDTLPMPAWDLLDLDKYSNSSTSRKYKESIAMITSRGCPFNCIYCNKKIFGFHYRARSAKKVIEEIKYLMSKRKKDIMFVDDIFNLNQKRTEEICRLMKRETPGLAWNCYSRVNVVQRDIFEKMYDAGCYEVSLGLESGSQRILDLVDKGLNVKQMVHAVNVIKKTGMIVKGFFIIGFPYETKEDIEETMNLAVKMNLDYITISFATPFPGTRMYDMAKKTGTFYINEDSQTMKGLYDITYVPEGLTEEYLRKTAAEAYRKFYWNPRRLASYLKRLRNLDEIKKGISGSVSFIKMAMINRNKKISQEIEA
ncbi:MAG: radical SAM protein [Candidatus Nanoarchaeia archaeon]|nr:radical SAM protein [Candidatus Nanoarchaeia archaeon]